MPLLSAPHLSRAPPCVFPSGLVPGRSWTLTLLSRMSEFVSLGFGVPSVRKEGGRPEGVQRHPPSPAPGGRGSVCDFVGLGACWGGTFSPSQAPTRDRRPDPHAWRLDLLSELKFLNFCPFLPQSYVIPPSGFFSNCQPLSPAFAPTPLRENRVPPPALWSRPPPPGVRHHLRLTSTGKRLLV